MSVIKTLIDSAFAFDLTSFLVLVTVVLITYLLFKRFTAHRLPPGPPSLPIIGSILFLDTKKFFYEEAKRLAKKYNTDILSLNVFGRQMIVLMTQDLAREAFQKRADMANRPPRDLFKAYDPNHRGMATSSGPVWRDHRRFALSIMRDFGMGKSKEERTVQDEAVHLCNRIIELTEKDGFIDPLMVLEPAVANIISAILLGQRYNYEHEQFNQVLKSLNQIIQALSSSYNQIILSPTLYWLAPYICPDNAKIMEKNYAIFCEFLDGVIAEHRETFHGSVNDLIDAFLVEQQKKDSENANGETFTDTHLRYLIHDLFMGGSETTTSTLRWFLVFLVQYPECQWKMFEELNQAIGPDRLPGMKDKRNTPYTEAFMLEVQRLKTVLQNALPHSCTEDVEFYGYTIPAGTTIIYNIAGIHRDERVFEEPDTFKVERFLKDNKVVNAEHVIQFGVGKRVCPGEALARVELYIFLTTLVLKFKFETVDETMELIGLKSTIYSPKPFKIKAVPR